MNPSRAVPLLLSLTLAGLAACSNGEPIFGDSFDHGRGPGDQGPLGCGPDEVQSPEGCLRRPDPLEPCPFRQRWLSHCADADGDCFVAPDCDLGIFAPWSATLVDCDDTRPAVHPGAEERCNDRDDDCDGAADEDFGPLILGDGIGSPCEACGRPGKLECVHHTDDGTLACSTAGGQSGNLDPPPERCDGLDDDCDGRVDEACFFEDPAFDRASPAVCAADRIAFIEAGAVIVLQADADGRWTRTPVTGPEAAAHHLSCQGDQLAWLSGGDCETSADLERCPGAAVVRLSDGRPINLTEPTTPGPPRFAPDGSLWWHTLTDDGPLLVRHGAEGITRPEPDFALSDPRPEPGGLLARQWSRGQAEITLRAAGLATLFDGPGRPGPPARSPRWLAWAFDDGVGIWVRALDGSDHGFQPTLGPGPHRAPELAGDTLVWLDGDRLTALDLRTGVARIHAQEPGGVPFAVGSGQVIWLSTAGDRQRLLRDPLPGGLDPEPEPGPEPDPAPGG